MKVLYWYVEQMKWKPALKTLEDAPEGREGKVEHAVVAYVHVEPEDEHRMKKMETKLIKTLKWLAGKWESRTIVLHSFSHLSEMKAEPEQARQLFEGAKARLAKVNYEVLETPWGYFLDLEIKAPGHPLARIFKAY